MMRLLGAALGLAVLLSAPPVRGQAPAARAHLAGVGFGVDTTAADVGDIYRLLRAYLALPQGPAGDSAARARGYWRDGGERGRMGDDIAGGFAYQGFPASLAGVISTAPGDSVYMVKVLYAAADSAGVVRPMALQRLYAVKLDARFGWQLTGALPRTTRDWPRLTVGRITFRYAPGQRPDSARARQAALFADSVARLMDVPPPRHIDYIVAGSPDEYNRAIGLDYWVWASGRGSATGGNGMDGLVLAGDPRAGEAYLHELTHAVLQRHCCANGVASEGIATWLGGSRGRTPGEMYALLTRYQRAHPAVTLRQLLAGEGPGSAAQVSDAGYATDALIVDAVFRAGGPSALRAFARTPGPVDSTLAALRRFVPAAAKDPDGWWRRAAARQAPAVPAGRAARPTLPAAD